MSTLVYWSLKSHSLALPHTYAVTQESRGHLKITLQNFTFTHTFIKVQNNEIIYKK